MENSAPGCLLPAGYSIFVIRGQLPRPSSSQAPGPDGSGEWMTQERAKQANEAAANARKRGRLLNTLEDAFEQASSPGGAQAGSSGRGLRDDERQMATAIAASLAQSFPGSVQGSGGSDMYGPVGGSPAWGQAASGGNAGAAGGTSVSGYGDEDSDLAAAIAASLAGVEGPASAASTSGRAEVAAAAAAATTAMPKLPALGEEPPEGEGTVNLAFRLPDGRRVARSFHLTDCSAMLYAYLASQGVDVTRYVIAVQLPRSEVLLSDSLTLTDLSITERQLLNVEPQAN